MFIINVFVLNKYPLSLCTMDALLKLAKKTFDMLNESKCRPTFLLDPSLVVCTMNGEGEPIIDGTPGTVW